MVHRRGNDIIVTPDDPLFHKLRAVEWPVIGHDYGEKITGVHKWNDLGQPICVITPAAWMPFLFGDARLEMLLALSPDALEALRHCLQCLIPAAPRSSTGSFPQPRSARARFSVVARAAGA